MPIQQQITSPLPYSERFLFFGDGGAGKSTAVLNMARYMPYAKFWVNDTDISRAYERLMYGDYPDVYERDQVEVRYVTDWKEFVANNDEFAKKADMSTDVLVIDNATFPWQWCQDDHVQAQYGMDVDEFMGNLKKQYKGDDKAYFAALSDGMQWPLINKKFYKGLYRVLHKWQGHAILVAMSKDVKGQRDQEVIDQFAIHGAMPAGQKDMQAVMATNVLFMTRSKNTWAISTTKDRTRDKQTRLPVEKFAIDYLVNVAGWDIERVRP